MRSRQSGALAQLRQRMTRTVSTRLNLMLWTALGDSGLAWKKKTIICRLVYYNEGVFLHAEVVEIDMILRSCEEVACLAH